MADCVLQLDDISKGFPRGREWLPVLQDVSLTVAAGEVVSVVGTRDQGKTTLLRVAAGTLLPDKGVVRLGGRNLGVLKDRELARLLREEVGLATRDGPRGGTRVRDYVGVRVAAARWRGRRRRSMTLTEALGLLGVADCTKARWRDLSNWQRARIELAQAVASRPRLVFVDDLLDGLTFGQKVEATDVLRELAGDLGCGILMACSDQISALGTDRIWRLDEGELKLLADLSQDGSSPLGDAARPDEATG